MSASGIGAGGKGVGLFHAETFKPLASPSDKKIMSAVASRFPSEHQAEREI